MQKIYKTILMVIISFTILCGYSEKVAAATPERDFDLLLELTTDLGKVQSTISKILPEKETEIVSEIALIRIKSINDEEKTKILEDDYIKSNLIESGTLVDFKADKKIVNSLSEEELNNNFLNKSKLKSIDNIELFDLLGWHVDKVTENRKSLDISRGGNVNIALIDSGVDTTHPVFEGKLNLDKAKSYVENDKSINDTNGHGTMVAGILAQIAPEATITPYRVIGDSTGNSIWTIEAIIQAANDQNDLINMSLGTYKTSNNADEELTIMAFQRAVEYAQSKEKIVLASAGNQGLDLEQYYENESIIHLPGSLDGVLSVSSVNNEVLTSYSNFGVNIAFTAPGGDFVTDSDGFLDLDQLIYCTYPTYMDNGLSSLGFPQGYTFSYGTSLSTPQVTAGLATILSFYRNNSLPYIEDKIVSALIGGCIDIGESGYDRLYGHGLINIYKALNYI